jgi:hypothetical protein
MMLKPKPVALVALVLVVVHPKSVTPPKRTGMTSHE